MSSRLCVASLLCFIALTAPLSAAQSDSQVVQNFYDNMCTFAKSGWGASEYTFLTTYLADAFIGAMITGKPFGKPTALAELQNYHAPAKPTSCSTVVRNVVRNGDQITAEVTLHALSGDGGSIFESVDRYEVVFVNSPPWQELKSTELERWDLKNGKAFSHTLLPGTPSQLPAGSTSMTAALGDQVSQAQSTPDAALTARFTEFLTDVLVGHLPLSGIASEFRRGFTRDRIALVDNDLAPLGAFQALRFVSLKTVQGNQLYHYDAVFANGTQRMTFFVDPAGNIAGLLTGYA